MNVYNGYLLYIIYISMDLYLRPMQSSVEKTELTPQLADYQFSF